MARRALFRRHRGHRTTADAEVSRELEAFLAERTDDLVARGMSEPDARAEAMRRLGLTVDETTAMLTRSAAGEARRLRLSETLNQLTREIRYAVRSLRRQAGFTTFAMLIAGLGIGASSTVFNVVNALLLRPLPFAEPDRLVWIANKNLSGLSGQTTQVGHMVDLGDRAESLSALAGYFAFYGVGDNVMTGRGEPERLSGVPVTQNFFDVLGVHPALGRSFTADEGKWNGPKAVMLSHAFWARRFRADPSIVGQALTINDASYDVIGVLPASFDFASVFAPGGRFELFFAFPLTPETNRWGNTMAMIGRLKPGVSAAAAQAETTALAATFTTEHSDRNSFTGIVTPLAEHVRGKVRLALWVLAGAVGVVLLIVCANLSNLLLARTAARQKEMAIRTALGAGRRRLVVQMLIEGLVLSSGGAVLGLTLAIGGTRAIAHLDALGLPLLRDVHTDAATLVFMLVLAAVTGIAFALAPALQAPAVALHNSLKEGTRGSTEGGRQSAVRSTLVVAEIAFACLLLVSAGLLIRSFVRLLDVDLGFRPESAATVRVDPDSRFATPAAQRAYLNDVLGRVRAIPGVTAAGITDALPLGRNRTWGARAKGVTYERGQAPTAYVRIVSDGYAAALGIPVRQGRDFLPSDTATSEPVVVVNETMARTLWPGQNAVGQYLVGLCGVNEWRVAGVVGDVRHLALEQESGNEMYLAQPQCDSQSSADLVVRGSMSMPAMADAVRHALQPIAPTIVGNEFRSLQQIVDQAVSPRRFTVVLLGGFAAFALILASLGIYALISYSVSQRVREIGIRIALGASTGSVTIGILAQTARLAGIGLVIGAAASWLLARSLSGLLFEITPADPVTFLAMAGVLALVALAAGYVPARRATRVDPVTALRAD
jgi:predicted permease